MSEVTVAALTADFDAQRAVAGVVQGANMVRIEGREKTRPAGAGIKFGVRGKQRQAAQPTQVDAVAFVVEQRAAERLLGA